MPASDDNHATLMRRTGRFLLALARRIGHIQAWILLTACYFLVLGPVALLFRCLSDPLRLRARTNPSWFLRPPVQDRGTWARAQ